MEGEDEDELYSFPCSGKVIGCRIAVQFHDCASSGLLSEDTDEIRLDRISECLAVEAFDRRREGRDIHALNVGHAIPAGQRQETSGAVVRRAQPCPSMAGMESSALIHVRADRCQIWR